MLLSIIVPVYNMMAGGKLKQCIESLLKQELTDYEIIAVDDKSTDDSLQYIQKLAKEHADKLRVIPSPINRKQGGARNLGLKEAKGEWVGFVDSDDWVSTQMYAKLLKKAEETGADIVACDYILTDTTGVKEGQLAVNNTSDQTGELDHERLEKIFFEPGSMVIKIYKKSLFTDHDISFPENIFYEDNAIAPLPFLYAKRFARVEEGLYFYYQFQDSTVHVVSEEKCEHRMKAMEIYKDELTKRGMYDTFREVCEYKIFELGYRNTLFSYMQSPGKHRYGFVKRMRKYLLENVPDFEQNSYFQKMADGETKKLTHMHKNNALLFLLYYEALFFYRRLRTKK